MARNNSERRVTAKINRHSRGRQVSCEFILDRSDQAFDHGDADLHAAGRHTDITELLRNGTSLVVARELARHSDVKMTMRYTHIGLKDQAKAIENLPTDSK